MKQKAQPDQIRLSSPIQGVKKSDFFRCEALSSTLLKKSCGKRWLRAEEIEIREDGVCKEMMSYMLCRGCVIGKRNSVHVDTDKLTKVKTVNLGRAVANLPKEK